MRIAIAGAGKVGRAIATDLVKNGHDVVVIDREAKVLGLTKFGIEAIQADACEVDSLNSLHLETCGVLIAATGDDKANLVVSLLAKTEFAVPHVVARVNHPANEWLFDEAWGVDTAVSTPDVITGLVEEAVTTGELVRLLAFRHGEVQLVEMVLPVDSPVVGASVGSVAWPTDCTLVAIVRDGHVITPTGDDPLDANDELLFIIAPTQMQALTAILR